MKLQVIMVDSIFEAVGKFCYFVGLTLGIGSWLVELDLRPLTQLAIDFFTIISLMTSIVYFIWAIREKKQSYTNRKNKNTEDEEDET